MVTDLSLLAPSADIPTMSAPAAIGATGATTIVGSAGWLTAKRTGVAEQAAGDTSANAAGLDRTGSTRFTYPGTGAPIAFAGNTRYIATDFKPGSTAALQAARWLMTADFIATGDRFELRSQTNAAAGRVCLLVVNGKRVQTAPFTFTGLTAGAGYSWTFTFPSAATRHIQMYGIMSGEGRFGGVAPASGASIVKPSSQGLTYAVVGDSWVNGGQTGNASQVETFAWEMALRMGAETIIQAGIGSTGFAATLSGQPTSNFAGRAAMVLAENPNVVIIAGGRNDSSGIQTTIESCIQDYLTGGISASNIYVVPTCSEASQAALKTDMINACATKGVRFVNLTVDNYAKIAGDTAHMTLAAHTLFGDDAANLILNVPNTRASARVVTSPTLSATGSVSVTPGSRAQARTVTSPTLTATGSAPATPNTRAAARTVNSPTLTATGHATATPASRAAARTVNSPTLTPGPVTVTPNTRASARTVNSPTLTATGAASVTPASRATARTVGAPTLTATGSATASPASRAAARTVNAPTISPAGHATVTPASRAAAQTVNSPTLSAVGGLSVTPASRAAARVATSPSLLATGAVTVLPASRASSRVATSPALSPAGHVTITPTSRGTRWATSSPVLSATGAVTVHPGTRATQRVATSPALSLQGKAPVVVTELREVLRPFVIDEAPGRSVIILDRSNE